ncbi:MAG: phosphoglycerate kinase [Dehalococcoidia bacterium]|nr:phosphoglycerate kinase [Dehalococcoidia bacterium]
MKTLSESEIYNKNIFLRVDLNVPMMNGKIRDESKITSVIPTIKYLIKNNNRIIICSHLGRPKGSYDKNLSLEPIAKRLSKFLENIEIKIINLPFDNLSRDEFQSSNIYMLENIRFDSREELNSETLSNELSKFADIYINDAFASSHRKHASTYGITKFLPSYAGFFLEKEINSLNELFSKKFSKKLAIVGGAKVSDKIQLINNLSKKLDFILIGGGMISAFVQKNHPDHAFAEEIVINSKAKIIIPEYVLVGNEFNENTKYKIINTVDIEDNLNINILDIAEKSFEKISDYISSSDMIIWNGPVGVFEWANFSHGTLRLIELLKNTKAKTFIGGGSTAEIIHNTSTGKFFTHISTGGGATLEFLEGKELPGIKALL